MDLDLVKWRCDPYTDTSYDPSVPLAFTDKCASIKSPIMGLYHGPSRLGLNRNTQDYD